MSTFQRRRMGARLALDILLRCLPRTVALFAVMASYALAQELPSGGRVAAGDAAIGAPANGALQITQQSDRAVIDWNNFSIGRDGKVHFDNGLGATLNRVTGTQVSSIDGLLSATGSLFLLNPNGTVIGRDGRVDVGGSFVASTQAVAPEAFMQGGDLTFKGQSEAAILNYGKIGSLGGDVALIAAKVKNEGEIEASKGTAALVAGYEVLMRDAALDDGRFVVKLGGADTEATNEGMIRAADAELRANGGNVYALAGNRDGIINATGVENRGGRIFLTSGEGGLTQIEGKIDASSATGKGGNITALGKHVGLFDGAELNASGATGGGTVLVGGNWQGKGPEQNAEAVVMSDDARIKADATQKGDGGTVVLWSDNFTNFLGDISARGGAQGGKGGMVETSSKNILQAEGNVDASAPFGTAGEWLLDPTDIYIRTGSSSGSSSSGSNPLTFTATGSSAYIQNSLINNALSLGTSVVVSTSSGNTNPGNIYIDAPITKSNGGDATLSLLAAGSIYLRSDYAITSTSGKLNVLMNSRYLDSDQGTALGEIQINGNISTNGGNLTLAGGASG